MCLCVYACVYVSFVALSNIELTKLDELHQQVMYASASYVCMHVRVCAVCVYVCIYACMYICMYICMCAVCVYVCIYACMYICFYICMCAVRVYACVCVTFVALSNIELAKLHNADILTQTYAHTHIHTHTYIHTYMHIYIHAYIHTCLHACMHTYIHTYIHTYTHTHTNTCTQARNDRHQNTHGPSTAVAAQCEPPCTNFRTYTYIQTYIFIHTGTQWPPPKHQWNQHCCGCKIQTFYYAILILLNASQISAHWSSYLCSKATRTFKVKYEI
jgi:hypothetical protein